MWIPCGHREIQGGSPGDTGRCHADPMETPWRPHVDTASSGSCSLMRAMLKGKWRRCCFRCSGGSLGGAAAFWPAKVALSTILFLRVAVLPHWQWHCRPSSSQAHNCHVLEPGEGFGWGCLRGMHNDRGSPNLTLRLAIEHGIHCGRNHSVRT